MDTYGVEAGDTDPIDGSQNQPNPAVSDHCRLARGLRNGESVLEFVVSSATKSAKLAVSTNNGSAFSLGYTFNAGESRAQFLQLTVTRDRLTLQSAISLSFASPIQYADVTLTATLGDGRVDTCSMRITPTR
jgi:hypothetical protein